jgi:hypothetical protein
MTEDRANPAGTDAERSSRLTPTTEITASEFDPVDPERATATGLDSSDFISGYANYADVLEAPRVLHEIVGIQVVATALNRKGVTIPLGAVKYSLDLWALLLSGSGAGRSTTIGMVAPILEAAGMQDLESSVRWGSAGSFYQHFSECPSGLHFWGEMAEHLRMMNDPQFATVKEWLTDRYDSFKFPPAFRFRVTGKKADTPAIVFDALPRINILATSSNDWFFRNLAEQDSAGGFLPRWLIMQASGNRRDVPIPEAPNASLLAPMADRLKQIGQLTGPADLSEIVGPYEQWYIQTKRRFEAQSNPNLALAYFHRHRGHVLKLAVIFEASQSGTHTVSLAAWKRSIGFAARVEQCIFQLLPTGMSAVGFDLQRIEERVREGGRSGMTQNKLTRCFQSMPKRERNDNIQTLIDAGAIIRIDDSPTNGKGGRPKTVYFHSQFHQGRT